MSHPERPHPEYPLDGPLLFLQTIWALDHVLQSHSKRMRSAYGITGPQRLVLRIVGLYPGLSSTDLSGILHLHPSTLTGIVERLRSGGYLERTADPGDGRRALLRLTAKGRNVTRRREGTIENAAARALSSCRPSELKAALALLGLLAVELGRLPAGRSGAARPRPSRTGAR